MVTKLGIIGVLFLIVFSVPAIAAGSSELWIDNIRFLDRLEPGSYSEMIFSVRNSMDSDADDLSAEVYLLPEYEKLNLYSPEFDAEDDEISNNRLLLYMPSDIRTGYHVLKIKVSNDDLERIRYVPVII